MVLSQGRLQNAENIGLALNLHDVCVKNVAGSSHEDSCFREISNLGGKTTFFRKQVPWFITLQTVMSKVNYDSTKEIPW